MINIHEIIHFLQIFFLPCRFWIYYNTYKVKKNLQDNKHEKKTLIFNTLTIVFQLLIPKINIQKQNFNLL